MAEKKKKNIRRKRVRKGNKRLWISMGALLSLLVCALFILLYLERHREVLQEWIKPKADRTLDMQKEAAFDQIQNRMDTTLESLFRKYRIDAEAIQIRTQPDTYQGERFLLKRLVVHLPEKEKRSDFEKDLSGLMKKFKKGNLLTRREIAQNEERLTLSLRIGEKLIRQVILVPSDQMIIKRLPRDKKAKVAIIVDDIGESLGPVKEFLSMNVHYTFSILPGLEHSADAAKMVHKQDMEIMLHLPMEPIKNAHVYARPPLLTVKMSPEEILSHVKQYFDDVPFMSGVNNHMGSLFTQDKERMSVVLNEMKKKGFFFIDSMTIGSSVAYQESLRLGLVSGKRDIFLDHEDQVDAIRRQIDKMVQLALNRGSVIAICHPKKNTIKVLQEMVDKIQAQGIEIVPVSDLLDFS